jgi:hypothetical protein
MDSNPKSETVLSGRAIWYVGNRNVTISPNTEPAGLEDCFFVGAAWCIAAHAFAAPAVVKHSTLGFLGTVRIMCGR